MRGKFAVLVVLLMISVFPVIAVVEPLFLSCGRWDGSTATRR